MAAPLAPPVQHSAFVISITPFTTNGEIDESGMRAHLRRLAAAGIGVYVGGGGSGEGYTLARSEIRRLLAIAVDELKGVVPVRAMGREPRTAMEMIESIHDAASEGVDATQIYSLDVGHGHRPVTAAIELYLRTTLKSTELPCVVSSHQSVGYKIPVSLYATLLEEFPHLIGVNCSHADQTYLRELIGVSRGRATVHVGGEAAALPAMAFGAEGFLSSAANLAPNLAMNVVRSFAAGALDGWVSSYATLHELGSLLYSHGGILATKAILNQLGLAGGYPRLPHLPIDEHEAHELADRVRALGVPDIEHWEGRRHGSG